MAMSKTVVDQRTDQDTGELRTVTVGVGPFFAKFSQGHVHLRHFAVSQ